MTERDLHIGRRRRVQQDDRKGRGKNRRRERERAAFCQEGAEGGKCICRGRPRDRSVLDSPFPHKDTALSSSLTGGDPRNRPPASAASACLRRERERGVKGVCVAPRWVQACEHVCVSVYLVAAVGEAGPGIWIGAHCFSSFRSR